MSLDLSATGNEQLLRTAVDGGINYFDTADLYDKGANEALIGAALKPVRQHVIIATKVGNEWLPDGTSWRWNPSKRYISQAVDSSLHRLQTDYIDIYQLHGGTIEDDHEEVLEAFEQLVTAGKIRHYGISSIRPNVIQRFCDHSNIVSNMTQYSLLDRRPEEDMLALMKQQQVGVMARGTLAKGLLAGKPPIAYMDYSSEEVHELHQTLNQLSSENRSLAQTALKYVLHQPAVTSAVTGFRNLKQLKATINTSEAPDLTAEEYKALSQTLVAATYTNHRI